MVLHPHTLDHIAVCQAEQIFPGAVDLGYLHICRVQRREDKLLFQLFAKRLGEIAHLIKICHQLLMKPLVNLLCPEGLISHLADGLSQFLQSQGFDVLLFHNRNFYSFLRNAEIKNPSHGYLPGRSWT